MSSCVVIGRPIGTRTMLKSDGILILLAAKLVCCGLLGLAAAGLLGGAIGWLFGPGFWIVGVAFAAVMALIVLFPPRPRSHGEARSEDPHEGDDDGEARRSARGHNRDQARRFPPRLVGCDLARRTRGAQRTDGSTRRTPRDVVANTRQR